VLIASVALAALAIALAWPVPLLLTAARWPTRAPATALLLWQAIALAGGLSMIGALLTFGLIPFGDDLVGGLVGAASGAAPPLLAPHEFGHVLALCGAVLLGAHLLLNLALTLARTQRDRRRHRALLQLLSHRDPAHPGAVILESDVPMAYCVPGTFRSLTVFSAGLLELLDEEQVQAVVEHERAHLAQRHDLVLVAFRAWHVSLPWFPVASRAEREVGLLVEMLADDRARRRIPAGTLARAIALIVGAADQDGARVPAAASTPMGRDSLVRAMRLARGVTPLPRTTRALIALAAAALVMVPTILLLAPAVARLSA
jgi:Zn-dependent protease with chaperone function